MPHVHNIYLYTVKLSGAIIKHESRNTNSNKTYHKGILFCSCRHITILHFRVLTRVCTAIKENVCIVNLNMHKIQKNRTEMIIPEKNCLK